MALLQRGHESSRHHFLILPTSLYRAGSSDSVTWGHSEPRLAVCIALLSFLSPSSHLSHFRLLFPIGHIGHIGRRSTLFSPIVALCLLGSYTLATFIIPAGFLQVSRHRRYLAAFHLLDALSLIRRKFRLYIRAWYHSIVMSLGGHFAIPFSPWGVVWCYLGIIYVFNSILVEDPDESEVGTTSTWFARLSSE